MPATLTKQPGKNIIHLATKAAATVSKAKTSNKAVKKACKKCGKVPCIC